MKNNVVRSMQTHICLRVVNFLIVGHIIINYRLVVCNESIFTIYLYFEVQITEQLLLIAINKLS